MGPLRNPRPGGFARSSASMGGPQNGDVLAFHGVTSLFFRGDTSSGRDCQYIFQNTSAQETPSVSFECRPCASGRRRRRARSRDSGARLGAPAQSPTTSAQRPLTLEQRLETSARRLETLVQRARRWTGVTRRCREVS